MSYDRWNNIPHYTQIKKYGRGPFEPSLMYSRTPLQRVPVKTDINTLCMCCFFYSLIKLFGYNRIPALNFITLSSNTTATKETFIVLKVFIMRNSPLYHLKALILPFFYHFLKHWLRGYGFHIIFKFEKVFLKNIIFKQFYINKLFCIHAKWI